MYNPDNYVNCNTVSEITNWACKPKGAQRKANEKNCGMVSLRKKCWTNKQKWINGNQSWVRKKYLSSTTKMAYLSLGIGSFPRAMVKRKKKKQQCANIFSWALTSYWELGSIAAENINPKPIKTTCF